MEFADPGFGVPTASGAALGKNALFLDPTTVAESLVRTYISFVYNCAVTNSQALLPRGSVDGLVPRGCAERRI